MLVGFIKDIEESWIVKISVRLTNPWTKVAEQLVKAPSVSSTNDRGLDYLGAALSMPMVATKFEVLMAGSGFLMLARTILTSLIYDGELMALDTVKVRTARFMMKFVTATLLIDNEDRVVSYKF